MRRLQLLGYLGGMSLLVGGPLTATAASNPNFVWVKADSGQVAVYSELPRQSASKPHKKRVSGSPIFRVIQQRSGVHGVYLDLAHFGWVSKAATVKLTHVKSNGTLSIVKQQRLTAQIASLNGRQSISLTTNGPVATQTHTNYRQLKRSQLQCDAVHVSKVAWTDFGQFYWLQGRQVAGWVNASQLRLKPAIKRKPVRVTKRVVESSKRGSVSAKKKILVKTEKVKHRGTIYVKPVRRASVVTKTRVTAKTVIQPVPVKVKPIARPAVVAKPASRNKLKPQRVVVKKVTPATAKPTTPVKTANQKSTIQTTVPTKPAKTSPVVSKPVTATNVKPTTQPTTAPAKPASTTTPTVAPTKLSPTMAKIDAIMTQNHFMGTLLVTNSGPSGVKVQAFGDANVADKVANTTDEAYPLASLQKAVTGALVQQLVNSGKLTMSTTLAKFYPTVPYASQITIRELLDHTSGIRMGEPVPTTILPDEAAAVAFTLSHLTSTNQHVWSYSNANFTLLAGIISQVTGQSYWANVQTGIIAPLKLKNMYLYNQVPTGAISPASYTYEATGSKADAISLALLSSELGCGNLYASVGDYYTVINSLLSGKLDGQAGINQLADDYALQYSGGIYYQAGNLVRIGGADNSFHTVYVGTNDGRVGVVLFTNQSVWTAANNAAKQILQLVNTNEQL